MIILIPSLISNIPHTTIGDIESHLKRLLARKDIGIVLINQHIANDVRHIMEAHTAAIPALLEIPSKEHPYDPAKDSILKRAKGMFNIDDMR
ncbi:V-type proton ATPase subunit F-like [Bolinopsis microptera]|uniref:V-type proton ATPase subunit F-like n=1 Tax=Bolinopsis microptera TaxID=2820187 RepID=UPI00307A4856